MIHTDLSDRPPLGDDERRDLAIAEEVIRDGLDKFRAVGGALLAIRDRRLYREDYHTFDQYCSARFGITPQRGYQLINAVEVCKDLEEPSTTVYRSAPTTEPESTTVYGSTPTTERQIRPLVPLDPDERRAAWDEAVRSRPDGTPTGRDVEAAARRVTGKGVVPGPPARVVVNADDPVQTARDIVAALDGDCNRINRLIRAIADNSDDPHFFWVQGKRLRKRRDPK